VIETKNKEKTMNETNPITGTLYKLEDPVTFASGFSKREFVVKVDDGKYPQHIKFEIVKDNIDKLNSYKVGDSITVHFNIRGNEHNNKFFNNLVAWRLEKAQASTNDPGDQYKQAAGQVAQDDGDEIPF